MPAPKAPRKAPAKAASGGAFITSGDSIPDPKKAEQARKATAAGPPPGMPPLVDDDPATPPAQPAPAPAPAPKPRPQRSAGDLPRPSLTPSISDGGGFLFGMLLYTLGINYLRNGLPGVKGWFGAKWLNHQNNFPNVPGGAKAAPQHVTPGVNSPYDIPYDGKQ